MCCAEGGDGHCGGQAHFLTWEVISEEMNGVGDGPQEDERYIKRVKRVSTPLPSHIKKAGDGITLISESQISCLNTI